jgi:hypothetical protein
VAQGRNRGDAVVAEVRIYFEGDSKLRPGLHQFLHSVIELARKAGIGFSLVAGGAEPVRDFQIALETRPEALNLLLIDSEGPVDCSVRDLVTRRGDWHASRASDVRDDQLHLMVQVMEAWFLADPDALAAYYGQGFARNRLPANPQVEQIPKTQVFEGLRLATRETKKKAYHKTRHAPALLESLGPDRVRKAAPHCERLFQALEAAIQPGGIEGRQ